MIVKPLRPHMESQFASLPKEVKFCTKCVMSNQRPRITFDDKGVCSACSYRELKNTEKVDFKKRHEELLKLLDNHRSKNKQDCELSNFHMLIM